MDEPKTILPEETILFQVWSTVAVGGTEGAGVGGLSFRQAVASNATSKSMNNTGLAFMIYLLFDESLSTRKDWAISDE
jgi:hypothetical protein